MLQRQILSLETAVGHEGGIGRLKNGTGIFFHGYLDRWGNGVLRAFGWAGAMSLFIYVNHGHYQ
jgi:hypothetical protein